MNTVTLDQWLLESPNCPCITCQTTREQLGKAKEAKPAWRYSKPHPLDAWEQDKKPG